MSQRAPAAASLCTPPSTCCRQSVHASLDLLPLCARLPVGSCMLVQTCTGWGGWGCGEQRGKLVRNAHLRLPAQQLDCCCVLCALASMLH